MEISANMAKDFDLSQLTEEQQALIKELLYKSYASKNADDTAQFVVPFIAMNDGHTPAQVKAISKGIYKDVQRNPFLRKTGVFDENNTIEDIDITPLVYYGSLQQAKIAPTLENIDIRLYYREPKLNKVPSPETEYGTPADTYIWRELPVGFHVFNNDTVYGYEWIVLQDNYSGTDGVYNLHMNVENGLGACKFAGTQAPINLAGVQYKIVITAKSLWNREFSLLDSMPLLKSLKSESNELAPTVSAIKRYYEEAVHTLEVIANTLFVPTAEEPMLFANKDGVEIKLLKLGDIENLENYVKVTRADFDSHALEAIKDAVYEIIESSDEDGKKVEVRKLKAPHGIVNEGAKGNIDAKTLNGLGVSNGQQALSENDTSKENYIPYVGTDNSIGIGTEINYYKKASDKSPEPIFARKFITPSERVESNSKILEIQDISKSSDVEELLHTISVGSIKFEAKLSAKADNGGATLELKANRASTNNLELQVNNVLTDKVSFNGGTVALDKDWVNYQSGASSIAYKIPISELLNIKVKDSELGKILKPNSNIDADGFSVEDLDTSKLPEQELSVSAKDFSEDNHFADVEAAEAFDKLGSALQALYELPLGTYTYKRGQDSYKEQLGIFVERVNQYRDNLKALRGKGEKENGLPSDDNYLVHKRVKGIQSSNKKVVDYDKGYSITKDSKDQGSEFQSRIDNNAYTYTEDEIKSIAHYLDLMTSKKELAQEIRNTVGILLKAAKETQERLLDVETNIYGFDARTIPGSDEAREKFLDQHIDEKLQSVLNNSPLLLGLNRLMRAICLELYDTTDLEKIDAEIRSVVGDSDSLQQKVTAKSRMDQIDDILSDLTNQASAITKYYIENVLVDESQHTYVDIYQDDEQRITNGASIIEDTTLLDNVEDDHSETKDIDKGRTWKNLPAADDVTEEAKAEVGFAQVASSAHKHTPNKEESGIVRVPEVKEYEHVDYDAEGNPTKRTWKEFVVDKDEETGTYHPKFNTKAVAWDTAKLERINKKLSEVTKDIYGVDDVTASLPNRTEVLRRNITNLVDDLYPNRIFDVEKKVIIEGDDTADIRIPFKRSRVQLATDQTKRAALQDDEVDRGVEHHTSIIPHINNELFNFSFVSNIFKNDGSYTKAFSEYRKYELLDSPVDYKNNKQITIDIAETGNVSFSTRELVTDRVELTNEKVAPFGSYFNNYSRLDLIENLIGIEDCFPTNLFKTTIYDALGINGNNLGVLDLPAKQQTNSKQQQAADEEAEDARLQQGQLQEEQDELEEELEELEDKVSSLSSEIATLQANVDNLTVAYEAKKAEEDKIALQLVEATTATFDTTVVQTQISNLESEIAALKANLQNNPSDEQLEAKIEAKEIALTDKEVELKNIKAAKLANDDLIKRLTMQLEAAQEETAGVLARRRAHYKQLRASQRELADAKSAIAELSSSLEVAKVNYANSQAIALAAQEIVDEEAVDINLLPSYKDELAYPDSKKIIQNESNPYTSANAAIEESSNLDYVLSRKQKSLQARITTLEAFADTLAKGLNRVDNTLGTALNLRPTTDLEPNIRFEDHDATGTFRELAEASATSKTAEHLIFDLDLSESFKEEPPAIEDDEDQNLEDQDVEKEEDEEEEGSEGDGTEGSEEEKEAAEGDEGSESGEDNETEDGEDEGEENENEDGDGDESDDEEEEEEPESPVVLVDTFNHNRDVFKIIANSRDVVKTPYKLATAEDASKYKASYTVTGILESDPKYLWFEEEDTQIREKYQAGNRWKIVVKYITDVSMIDTEDVENQVTILDSGYYHTIYLQHKEVTKDLKYMYNTDKTSDASIDKVLEHSKGWQNQTEYNIYKMVSDMFTSLLTNRSSDNNGENVTPLTSEDDKKNSLYYQMMLLAHPVGSIYMSLKDDDPAKLFGGVWTRIANDRLLSPTSASTTQPGTGMLLPTDTVSKASIDLTMNNVEIKTTVTGDIDHYTYGDEETNSTKADLHVSLPVNASIDVSGKGNIDVQRVYAWFRIE